MTGSSRPSDQSRPARARLPFFAATGGLGIAVLAGTWLLLRPTVDPPEEQIRAALQKLDRPDDSAAWKAARHLAEEVLAAGYRDPEFPGAAEFVLGVSGSRTADIEGESARRHASAVASLRASERQGLDETRRPEWSFALGTSLFALGRFETARPLLEEVWWSHPARDVKVRSGLALAEIDLARPEASPAVPIDQIVADLSAITELMPPERRRLSAIRTRSALRAGKLDEAGAALAEIESRESTATDVILMRAEILLAEGRFDEARKRLAGFGRPEAGEEGPARTAAAAYLLGRCEQGRGDPAAAERAFERAADLAPESPDGVRGALAAAALLQETGRDEEAFGLFRRAIAAQAAGDPPPLADDEVRRSVRAGWDAWAGRETFDRAVSLAVAAEPVLGREESVRLQAKGRERAATVFEASWQAGKESEQAAGAKTRNDRWRESGQAYKDLAGVVTESATIGEALRTAADHFGRGRAFEEAESALTELLDLKLPRLEAAVLARRGRVRLDLGRPDAAAEDFRSVVEGHPTDPEAFEARFLLGKCHLEQGDSEKAERAWRELLSLRELTPDAAEWRMALFALAELLHRRGSAALIRSERAGAEGVAGQADPGAAVAALDESIARFGEYVRRAGESERVVEARVSRADAMRRRAEVSLGRAAISETESLKDVHVREAERLLVGAVEELRVVQAGLAPQDDAGRLRRLGRELLKTAAFDLGHCYAALGRSQEAVVAFGAAVNRYPEDARVLPAYLRMAEAYRRLERPDDARAAVEQARLVLGQLPSQSLAAGSALTRGDWEAWLVRARDAGTASDVP